MLGILIYYPFIKTLDKKYLEDEQKAEANAEEAEEDFDFADLDLSDL